MSFHNFLISIWTITFFAVFGQLISGAGKILSQHKPLKTTYWLPITWVAVLSIASINYVLVSWNWKWEEVTVFTGLVALLYPVSYYFAFSIFFPKDWEENIFPIMMEHYYKKVTPFFLICFVILVFMQVQNIKFAEDTFDSLWSQARYVGMALALSLSMIKKQHFHELGTVLSLTILLAVIGFLNLT